MTGRCWSRTIDDVSLKSLEVQVQERGTKNHTVDLELGKEVCAIWCFAISTC